MIKAFTELRNGTFFMQVVSSLLFTVNKPSERHHFSYEMGKRNNFPIFSEEQGYKDPDEVT